MRLWRVLPLGGLLGLTALAAALALPAAAPSVAVGDLPVVTAGPFTFRAGDHALRPLAWTEAPYGGASLVPPYGPPYGALGVAMYVAADGRTYDHPVRQAQAVVNMLRNHALTDDERYLELATANAERLLTHADPLDDAIFFPYPFDFYLHGRGMLHAPWYSGMAQGIALSGFVRLYRLTDEDRWLDAAHATFRSFLQPPTDTRPWVTLVAGDLLWFEEYPWRPADHTYNGHVFAIYGLYDYWQLTGDEDAHRLLMGGLTTARAVVPLMRVPGEASRYCLARWCLAAGVQSGKYHAIHVGQLRQLYRMTGERRFEDLADVLEADLRL